MKTAISIPDQLFKSAEDLARRLKISRSALFSAAIREYIQHYSQENITKRLNEVYSDQSSSLDPILKELQNASVTWEKW